MHPHGSPNRSIAPGLAFKSLERIHRKSRLEINCHFYSTATWTGQPKCPSSFNWRFTARCRIDEKPLSKGPSIERTNTINWVIGITFGLERYRLKYPIERRPWSGHNPAYRVQVIDSPQRPIIINSLSKLFFLETLAKFRCEMYYKLAIRSLAYIPHSSNRHLASHTIWIKRT